MKKKLFVSISGMSGSGKTTLVKKLYDYYMEHKDAKIGFVQESARELLTGEMKGFDLSVYLDDWAKLTDEQKTKFELWQSKLCLGFRTALDHASDADIIISDRSPFDQMVYYILQCNDRSSHMYDDILNLSAYLASNYEVWTVMLDTALSDVIHNIHSEDKHHYTQSLRNLMTEKAAFLLLSAQYDMAKKILAADGMSEKTPTNVISAINDYIEKNFKNNVK